MKMREETQLGQWMEQRRIPVESYARGASHIQSTMYWVASMRRFLLIRRQDFAKTHKR